MKTDTDGGLRERERERERRGCVCLFGGVKVDCDFV